MSPSDPRVGQEPLRVGAGGLRRAFTGDTTLPRRGCRLTVLCQLFRRRVPRLRPPLRLAHGPVEASHLLLSTVASPADFPFAQLC